MKDTTAIFLGIGLLIVCFCALYFRLSTRMATLCYMAFVFGLLFLPPDLDSPNSRGQKAWGWFRWLWWPFQVAASGTGISHVIIVGSLVRLVYFGIAVFVLKFLWVLLDVLWYRPSIDMVRLVLNHQLSMAGRFLLRIGHFYIHEALIVVLGIIIADLVQILGSEVTEAQAVAQKAPSGDKAKA